MKKTVRKEFVLAVGICLIAVLIAGCEEQNLSTTRRDKLIAYENKQLKEQLAQREKEIEEQLEQLAQQEKKVEEQSRLLEECQQKKEVLETRFKKEADDKVSRMRDLFDQLSELLGQKNDQLRAQVDELRGQVSELEQELKKLKPPAEP
jgi:outer membrane murein-binding lipoprotein Lpp